MPTPRSRLRAEVRHRLAHLPERPFEELARSRDLFVSLFQIFHGMTPEEAEREFDQWCAPDEKRPPQGGAGRA